MFLWIFFKVSFSFLLLCLFVYFLIILGKVRLCITSNSKVTVFRISSVTYLRLYSPGTKPELINIAPMLTSARPATIYNPYVVPNRLTHRPEMTAIQFIPSALCAKKMSRYVRCINIDSLLYPGCLHIHKANQQQIFQPSLTIL